jgi:hypothetical protein
MLEVCMLKLYTDMFLFSTLCNILERILPSLGLPKHTVYRQLERPKYRWVDNQRVVDQHFLHTQFNDAYNISHPPQIHLTLAILGKVHKLSNSSMQFHPSSCHSLFLGFKHYFQHFVIKNK